MINERQQARIEYLGEQLSAAVSDLENALPGYSRNTLKKDLAFLVNEGLVLKTGAGRGVRYHFHELKNL